MHLTFSLHIAGESIWDLVYCPLPTQFSIVGIPKQGKEDCASVIPYLHHLGSFHCY